MMIVLLNLLMLFMLCYFVLKMTRKHGSFLQLGVFFVIQMALNYPLRILFLFYFPSKSSPSYPGLTSTDTLLHLSFLQWPGLLAFCVAYYVVDSRYHKHPILEKEIIGSSRDDVAIITIAFGLFLVGTAYKIATQDYMSFLLGKERNMALINLVDNLVMVGWIALAAVWYWFFSKAIKKPSGWALFFCVNASVIGYQVIQGSKTFLLLPVVIILTASYYVRGKVPIVGIAGLALFAAFFVFPYVHHFRNYISSTYQSIPSITELETKKVVREAYLDIGGSSGTASDRALDALARFAGADELYNIEGLVPSVLTYRLGRDLAAVPLALVPRAVWPTKPVIALGAEYGAAMGSIASVTPFPLGEMYWNYGKYGMVLGMAAWGVALALLMRMFDRLVAVRRMRFFLVCCYLSQIYWLTTGEGTFVMLLASLPKQIVVFGGVYFLARVIAGARSRGKGTGRNSESGVTRYLSNEASNG